MAQPKFRLQETNRQTRERRIVAALFVNAGPDGQPRGIPGSLNLVPDRPQNSQDRPTKLVLDFSQNYYDVLPVDSQRGGRGPSRGNQGRRPADDGDDEL